MTKIVLISIGGRDKPGVTVALMDVLTRHDVVILDIGQEVIHDQLALGMLVELPGSEAQSPAVKDFLFKAHELDLQVQFTDVDSENYTAWVAQQGKVRHVVTVLARRITAQQLLRVSQVVARYGMNIDSIQRLSGRVPLIEGAATASRACVEFSMLGDVPDVGQVRKEFLVLANELDVDIAYQEDTVFRRNRRLVAFDMDSTLIEAEVIDELAREAGVGAEVAAITEAAMQGELDFTESFMRRVQLLQGLDASVLDAVARRLPITEGAERLVATVRQLGYRTAILSGGFNFCAHYLQKRLGIDYVYANELEIIDGKLSGGVTGDIVDGERKAVLLQEIADKERIDMQQVIAVGDGANDLPMLSVAGMGIAFRAKPVVQESAQHAISTLGLDGILYLMGFRDSDKLA